ncbi:MAG: ubiquinol-cytochrome c reductase [Phycisphaerae bacterium]|jgi:predicted RNA-binding protein with PUA-like domain|nr:MAG: ubiquinol-cytochrome c reductase [Phycisphaerae bacterium]
MALWLLKTEPEEFSFEDLVKAKRAVWDGVANPTALKHIRTMKKADQAIIYHTGNEKSAVGIARIVTDPYPDPRSGDPKIVVFDLVPVRRFTKPVKLAQIKSDPDFADWELVRIPRLSVMPVPPALWEKIQILSEE